MSEKITLYEDSRDNLSKAHARQQAVEAAMEIIRAKALGGAEQFSLDGAFDQISVYADKIQEALKPKG